MNRISAAGNLSIEIQPDSWKLIVNGETQERVLLEASPGQPIRYIPMFAIKRRLPDTGLLPVQNIQRVVLGWSNEDESWHLGLLLTPEIAGPRGSRWCEIARWPDPDTTVFNEIASQAGRTLARTLSLPFNLIPPGQSAPAAPAAPVMPPLRDLPLRFEEWTLEKSGDNLVFVRAGRWARSRVLRIIWYAALAVVYVVLSVTSLTGVIALPKPEFLPYLGLATAALLAGMIAYMIHQLMTKPNRIVIDAGARCISGRRGGSERWRIDNVGLESIYVSQVVTRKNKKRVVTHGEINAYLQDGTFFHLITEQQPEDDLKTPAGAEPADQVAALTPLSAYTDLQQAGLWAAQTLDVPCWYDERAK